MGSKPWAFVPQGLVKQNMGKWFTLLVNEDGYARDQVEGSTKDC